MTIIPEEKTRGARARTGGSDLRARQSRTRRDAPGPGQRPRRQDDDAPKPRKKIKAPKPKEKFHFSFKLFDRWDPAEVTDPSLKGYVNMEPRLLPRTEAAGRGKYHKTRVHIVERLALKLMVSGHMGKKHRLTSGKFGGSYGNAMKVMEKALEIVEQKEKKNPLEVLAKAIENAAVREEVISYQLGSIIAREAVITSPQRRVDKTLRFIAQSAYRRSFNKKKGLAECVAEELILAARASSDSFAMKEKDRLEREAMGSR